MAKIITDFLDHAAAGSPSKIAFADENREMTFGTLQEEAMRVASAIMEKGFFKKPVAILMDKCVECVASINAVAYSGNFYTIIDTEMPQQRIARIFEILDPVLILTDDAHKEKAREIAGQVPVILYEEALKNEADLPAIEKNKKKILGTDILYVLFTSGSTGMPKGVVTPHKSVINYIQAISQAYEDSSDDIIGNQVPFYFVMSVYEIFGTIYNQATCYIIPKSYFAFPALLVQFIEEKKINSISWVPSALNMIAKLDAFSVADITCLKQIEFGGEVMPMKYLKKWMEKVPDAKYINGYGPTEVTDGCTYYIVDREFKDNEALPIGIPLPNTDIILLDEKDRPVTQGEGEICIRSDSMTYGYYKDPVKTAEVFVQNPLNPYYGEIIYRTGDLAFMNDRGELVFSGRKDFQIKHMGRRIELGEIEANISVLEGIEDCCCLYNTKKQQIVLFYTGSITEEKLQEGLASSLPAYMIPAKRRHLDAMPKNVNGKIDRKLLKEQL